MWGTVPLITSLMTIYLAFRMRRRSGKPAGLDESEWHDDAEPVLVDVSETVGSMSRIALVTAFPPGRGDLAEYGFQLARTLRDSFGIKPVIYADQSPCIEHELPGFEVVRCWQFNSAASFARLVREILRQDFDAVWFNIGLSTMGNKPHSAMIASALPCILRACGINTHITLHAFSENVDFNDAAVPFPAVYRLGARAATRLLLAANGVHVLLPSFRDRLVQLFGPNCGTIFVHPHGVFEFEGGAGQETPRVKARILAFGSWGTYKKLEPLLEAFEFVKQQSPEAELVVAGGDHPQAKGYLQSCATRYAHEPRIKFLGYVPENEVAALFRSSSVTVMPYSSCAGSSGVAHLACEYGVPILASDVPDLRELAQYENLRFEFYGAPSGHELPEALARLIHDDTLRKSIAEHNREAVRSLSLREVVGSYLRSFALTVNLPAQEDPSPAEI
jgi:glycosyltransferase involved in cell wall biosynthesis